MTGLALALAIAVELGSGFGTASATVESTTDQSMVVDLEVEVEGTADSVVVHLGLPGEDPVTIPLLPRDEGTYGVTTEVKPANYQVVFEVLGESPSMSEPVSLSDLGVAFGADGDPTASTDDSGRSPATQRWLWLGVALGAASLSALAFWVLGGQDVKAEVETDAAV